MKKQKFEMVVKGYKLNCTLFSGLHGKPAMTCNTPSAAGKAAPAKAPKKSKAKKKSNPSRRAKKR